MEGIRICAPSRFYAEQKNQEEKGKTVKERVLEAAETIGLKKTDQEVQNPNQEKGTVETLTERVKSAVESAKDKLSSERTPSPFAVFISLSTIPKRRKKRLSDGHFSC